MDSYFGKKRSVGHGVLLVLMVVLGVMGKRGVSAQQPQDCASKLVPCSAFLNSTSPPDTCCNPLREAVKTQLDCLCKLYSNKDLFKSLHINITEALQLPKHCGITNDLTACNRTGGATTPSAAISSPPPPPGGAGGSNGATVVAWIGRSGLMGWLLFWISLTA